MMNSDSERNKENNSTDSVLEVSSLPLAIESDIPELSQLDQEQGPVVPEPGTSKTRSAVESREVDASRATKTKAMAPKPSQEHFEKSKIKPNKESLGKSTTPKKSFLPPLKTSAFASTTCSEEGFSAGRLEQGFKSCCRIVVTL